MNKTLESFNQLCDKIEFPEHWEYDDCVAYVLNYALNHADDISRHIRVDEWIDKKIISQEETEKITERFHQIEREQKKAWGLDKISGGFVEVIFDECDNEKIYITIKSGVQSDCENRVDTEQLSLWRESLEWTD
jgi:hypothetical protein